MSTGVHVGRNNPCPCGSGRKFKKCCLSTLRARTMPLHPVQPNGDRLVFHQTPAQMTETRQRAVMSSPGTATSLVPPGKPERGNKQIIRGTAEHPFYVYGKGWTPLGELQPGDWLRTDNGWVEVNKVEDTGKEEVVYNLRVAEYHTYFVGAQHWGFGVWAHNSYNGGQISKQAVNTASKILTQYERLAAKYGVKLSGKRIAELNRLRNAGVISTSDLPATLLQKFPSQLAGLSLNQIRKLLGG